MVDEAKARQQQRRADEERGVGRARPSASATTSAAASTRRQSQTGPKSVSVSDSLIEPRSKNALQSPTIDADSSTSQTSALSAAIGIAAAAIARAAGAKRAREIGRASATTKAVAPNSVIAAAKWAKRQRASAASTALPFGGAAAQIYIPFIPFMSMPFMSPLAAPTPTTGKSTVTAPACSNVSVAFASRP